MTFTCRLARTGLALCLALGLAPRLPLSALAADTAPVSAGPRADAAADGPAGAVALRWALGSVGDGGTPTSIQKDTQLTKGSRLKFLVEPLSPCSVYLILLDSTDELHVLYRGGPRPAEGGAGATPAYIPPGSQWFELDDKGGMETFFLLASAAPLGDLERLLDRYAAAEAAGKRATGGEIVQEIRRLQKAHRNFERPVEKPVMIGGRTRGTDGDASTIDRLAVEVSADSFYDKTITIEH